MKSIDGSELPMESWIGDVSPPIHLDTIQLAGHSFGGCTLVS